jgi:signal transduction histidine kinase
VTERKRALERHAMLSRKVLVAQEEERARVARELHDELGQVLTAIRLEMGWFKKRLDTDAQVDMDMFHEAVKLVERAADESRRLVRGLRPPLLDDLGLEPAVRLLVDEFKDHSQVLTTMSIAFDERVRVPREVSLCTYRILQESLTNISRHSKATRASISLRASSGRLELEVTDDGIGFNPDRRHGCGIEGMNERANLVNGTLSIQSNPGAGTRVSFAAVLPRLGQELSA